ncbi:hypothetical protein Tsubulata_034184 [Turnera subulata]|uniref:RNA helicase n=1 Tax=Turnera subulata TaxID=218843 RepID=A0A9Q0GG11_9ROSI|nr:hypothetical protein Tsubulata_034184 [Turnera subulata]
MNSNSINGFVNHHHHHNSRHSHAWRNRELRGPTPPPAAGIRRGYFDNNYHQQKPGYHQQQQPLQRTPQSAVILLSRGNRAACSSASVESVIAQCNPKPFKSSTNTSGSLVARLYYQLETDAVAGIVSLWERRLAGEHMLIPAVDSGVSWEGINDINGKVRVMFQSHVGELMDGEAVKKLEGKIDSLSSEIAKVSRLLRRPNNQRALQELKAKWEGLRVEEDGILRRTEEFRKGMKCVSDYIHGKEIEELGVLRFDTSEGFNWSKIHCLILRECRRLEDGLPIYGYRSDILQTLHSQQVTVLIGETGSGKSTQLVQFLADSDIAASGSVLCTQPRKIAAISLAKRVGEESNGCYEDNSVVCHTLSSSSQEFRSKVIYMTDHCLLQILMSNKTLSGVSCIIVDEAHERSLNTDLLLALLKDLLRERPDLRLIIMSATVDASKLSQYFFGCITFHVSGRSFPVEIKYVPGAWEGSFGPFVSSNNVSPYVSEVIQKALEIHEFEEEGAILAFLTSQMEVEWASEKFQSPSAVAFPLHGKLSHEEQFRVFQNYPGKRKVIFATNLAETSLTIPGVKYVIDSGLVKESRFEPTSGMNVLRVSKISQSSANQRAGRAGRIEPGKCYRLYSESDYLSMDSHPLPEICKVHLGIAVLRILALGIKNVLEFDFIDAPSFEAVDMAIRNLVRLGAVVNKNNVFELTADGHSLVKLGVEPRLGKIILESCHYCLRKEGIVLAAAMANASSIFCRVGSNDDKQKSDRLKVQFCHHGGDLFTLLSVYFEWENQPPESRNKWCWENSINAKAMRRCKDTVIELENCLKNELNIIIPSYWRWNPHASVHDKNMKKIILASLADNVAMYSGYDRLGYEVVPSGEHFQLHPSCSLQVYGQKPNWVVFAELLSVSSQFLVCVTSVDAESFSSLSPPLFDLSKMEGRKLEVRVITGFGSTVLKRFCGKSNNSLLSLVSRLRATYMDERIGIEVGVDDNEVRVFASLKDIEEVSCSVNNTLKFEEKWLRDECLEKWLYRGVRAGAFPPVALFGAGAEIKHLELENRYLTVNVSLSNASGVDDKDLLAFFEKHVSGVCAFHKVMGSGLDGDDTEKWGRVTFLTPEMARKSLDFNGFELSGSVLKLSPSVPYVGGAQKSSFAPVKAKVIWPRRYSKGFAIVKCEKNDVEFVVGDCVNLLVGGRFIHCERSMRDVDSVVIRGLDRETSEAEILEALQKATSRRILDVFIIRGDAVNNVPVGACEEAILKEIAPFMPNQGPLSNYCHVQVFPPEPKDTFMRAWITFDGRLHLEAAKALQHIQGKALGCCFSWQKMQCERVFHTSLSCPAPVYAFIEKQLDSLLRTFNRHPGVKCSLERNENGSYRVKLSANATKTVAELRKPLEQLMNGRAVNHSSLTSSILQLLFTRDGYMIMKSLEREMRTYILVDRQSHNVRIFGPENKVALAEQKLVQSLVSLHENKQIDIRLRGAGLPHDLMRKVVEKFGPELDWFKGKFPDAGFTLNTRRHVISFSGEKDTRVRVEEIVHDFARSLALGEPAEPHEDEDSSCPICLCEVDDCYQLEACAHKFCRSCLVEQLESAMRGHDGFPICCTRAGCEKQIWLTDLKSLLTSEKLEDLFRASLGSFVASSGGTYRFCPSPDCPSIYRVARGSKDADIFTCGACYAETCTRCHLESHPFVSCERYREFKDDPDSSLREWCKGKEHVKSCPVCRYMIEKVEGCNHIECRCGRHICWVCLESFYSSDDCYAHLRGVHHAII